MTAGRGDFPEHFTFSQRYGYEPLPDPMRLEEISDDLRREIWNLMYRSIRQNRSLNSLGNQLIFSQEFHEFVVVVWGKFERIPESEIRVDHNDVVDKFKNTILRARFYRFMNFLETIVNETRSNDLVKEIDNLFTKHVSAYWLNTSQRPYWFFPCASQKQGEATREAIATLHENDIVGATTHFRQAGEAMNEQRYADSIRESIHAVESVAREIDPKSKTLGQALKSLEGTGFLNHEFKQALEKLYIYANAEQGVRHALLDKDAADVGLDEAVLMFGACASFAAYLTQKHRQAGRE